MLILFGPPPAGATDEGEHVVLIERSHTMRTQPAQIAFPGGARDPRTTTSSRPRCARPQEEVGRRPCGRRGASPSCPRSSSLRRSSSSAPVLGWWAQPSPIGVRDPAEVHDVLSVPVSHLVDPATPVLGDAPLGLRRAGLRPRPPAAVGLHGRAVSSVLELGGLSQPWDADAERPLPRALPREEARVSGSTLLDIALVLLLSPTASRGTGRGSSRASSRSSASSPSPCVAVWQLPAVLERWGPVADNDRMRVIVLLGGVIALRLARPVPRRPRRGLDPAAGRPDVAASGRLGARRRRRDARGEPHRLVHRRCAAHLRQPDAVQGDGRLEGAPGRQLVVPEQTGQVFAGFRGFLSSQGFPQVFGGLAPEPITPVQDPDPAVARSAGDPRRPDGRSSR